MTQVMLSMCELQVKGKGPYTEISTLLSDMVTQVQEFTKCVACLDSCEWKCSLNFFDI